MYCLLAAGLGCSGTRETSRLPNDRESVRRLMVAGGRSTRIFSQSTQQGSCLQEADALSAIAIVPAVRSLRLEIGETSREM